MPAQQAAWTALEAFERPFLCAFSDQDPITRGADRALLDRVPGTRDQPHTTLEGAAHFVQEDRGAGSVACWGGNAKGQLGRAAKASVGGPDPIPGITGAIGLASGGDSSCAVFGDGSFACWGEDSRGQLGDGTAGGTKASPTRVQRLY